MSGATARDDEQSSSCRPKNPTGLPIEIVMDESNHDDDEHPSELNMDPKENLKLQPKKSILKSTSSFDNERKLSLSYNREAHFDEMNILATFHPADKDYGHMKVDEPKTPYQHHSDSESEEGTSECVRRVSLSEPPSELDPKVLEERLMKKMQRNTPEDNAAVEEDDEDLESDEKVAKRKAFEMKRKQHYNEFQAVKLAKQLIEDDEKDLTDDDNSKS